jgi:hypothetical protein
LSGGFVATHPFNDGNGRVSRQLYAELSAGITPKDKIFEQITASSTQSASERGGSGIVNIGSFANQDPIIKKQLVHDIYKQTDVTKYNARFSGLNYVQNKDGVFYGPHANAVSGLTEKQALWIDDVYANVRDLNIDRTAIVENRGEDESFRFALSYAIENFPGYITRFEENDGTENRMRYLNVEKLLQESDTKFMSAVADGARLYYKQYAKSLIDMLGGSELADKQIEHPAGGTISLRDRIIEMSNNFLAESIRNKPDEVGVNRSLEARFSADKTDTVTDEKTDSSVERSDGKAQLGSRRNPVIIKNTGFRGDPRRVLGHPSNPFSNVSSAYADELKRREQFGGEKS